MANNYHLYTDKDLERLAYMEGNSLATEIYARWEKEHNEKRELLLEINSLMNTHVSAVMDKTRILNDYIHHVENAA